MSERNMSEQDTQFLLGKLIEEGAKRDAIHIAVAPVVAAANLQPGQHIAFIQEGNTELVGATGPQIGPFIGIVDPFLKEMVLKGQRFWMFLLPNTITSLRHQWTHPAFGATVETDDAREESRRWLESFAERLFSYDPDPDEGTRFDILMAGAEHGGFGTDIEYGPDCKPTSEFWMHYERYTGREVAVQHSYFRCAC